MVGEPWRRSHSCRVSPIPPETNGGAVGAVVTRRVAVAVLVIVADGGRVTVGDGSAVFIGRIRAAVAGAVSVAVLNATAGTVAAGVGVAASTSGGTAVGVIETATGTLHATSTTGTTNHTCRNITYTRFATGR